jgi:hypothetical protein
LTASNVWNSTSNWKKLILRNLIFDGREKQVAPDWSSTCGGNTGKIDLGTRSGNTMEALLDKVRLLSGVVMGIEASLPGEEFWKYLEIILLVEIPCST